MHASPRRIRRSGIVAATAMILLGGGVAVTTTDTAGAASETEPANFGNSSLWG